MIEAEPESPPDPEGLPMATATEAEPEVTTRIPTIAEILARVDVPPERVVLFGVIGAGTVEDVVYLDDHHDRLCELVDGILVEKAMGYRESRWALVLGYFIERFLTEHDIGIAAGEAGMMQLAPNMVRIPDVSFISYVRLPGGKMPEAAAPLISPDFVVEIISPSNPASEMDRKLGEYFAAGARLVWFFDPRERLVRVFTAIDRVTVLDESGTLDGGDVLPGFRLAVRDWFARAERTGPRADPA